MMKLMNKKLTKKGFTLAELLIVVAIIAVLVAVAIPVFTSQLEKAREATDLSNIRAAYAEIMVYAVSDQITDLTSSTGAVITYDAGTTTYKAVVTMNQKQNDWEGENKTAKVANVATSNFKRTDTEKTNYEITYNVTSKTVGIVAK